MKAFSSAIVFGIGFLMVSGNPARAQLGDMGEAVKKGAGDAVKQEIMKGAAEKAGLPTPTAPAAAPAADTGAAGAPAAAPAAGTGAASTPVGEPEVTPGGTDTPAAAPEADTGAAPAPEGEPKVAPGAAQAPAGMPGAAETMQDAAGKAMKKKMPKLP
jgi:hypothetical protein